jgi:6-phosphogluconolactonase
VTTPAVFDDLDALADFVASAVAAALTAAIVERGGAHLMLCGGRSPVETYRRLAGLPPPVAPDWRRVDVWYTDERAVPPDDPSSNHRLVRSTFAAPAGVPPDRVHRMRGEEDDLAAAARAYEHDLPAALDVVILGLGEDGHVASLFPGAPALDETEHRAVAVFDAPKPPPRRLTVTPPVLEAARRVLVLAIGSGKGEAAARSLAAGDPHAAPGRLVRGREWFLDREAAAHL